MTLEAEGKTIETTENGFLVSVDDWNEHVAEAIAAQESIALTQAHWDIINFLRDRYLNHAGDQPNNRQILKAMQELWGGQNVESKTLYALFPGNPSKQAGRIAGLPESMRKGGY
jgi:tRNA 2-thiouridine synthesizing protein E